MIIYIVTFPKNYYPRKIAYKCYFQARKNCEHHNISKKNIKILYMCDDENIISFTDI